MNFLRRKILIICFKLFDLGLMILSLLSTFIILDLLQGRHGKNILNHLIATDLHFKHILLPLLLIFVWHLIFNFHGIYQSGRFASKKSEALNIIKAVSVGTIVLIVYDFLFEVKNLTRGFVMTFWVLNILFINTSHLLLRHVLANLRVHGKNLRNMILVGTNPRALTLAKRISSKQEIGIKIIGFADNNWTKIDKFYRTGYALVANLKDLPVFIKSNVVDEVVICLPLRSFYNEIAGIINFCESQGIVVRVLADFFNLKLAHYKTEALEDINITMIYFNQMDGLKALFKQLSDLLISFVMLILLSPLFIITSILIKLTSKGPIFFIQPRIGFNKRRFNLYKFRTMIMDAEKMQDALEDLNEIKGPVFKIKKDPRITPLGKFLRKTSIDELPQLINILKGDMSLVGPRPLPERDVNGFDTDWHMRRFSVRPGMTCLWQINGRNDIPFDKWMKLDMEYIDQWSLFLDFKILLKTVKTVFTTSGAS